VLKGGKSKESTRMEAYTCKSVPRSGGGYGVWRIYNITYIGMSVEGWKDQRKDQDGGL
jgi:hypothetical protein